MYGRKRQSPGAHPSGDVVDAFDFEACIYAAVLGQKASLPCRPQCEADRYGARLPLGFTRVPARHSGSSLL
jgi:hypothetical protein